MKRTSQKITIPVAQVARELGASHRFVSLAIEQGLLPIGIVNTSGKTRRTYILRERWEAYKAGLDLQGIDLDQAHDEIWDELS